MDVELRYFDGCPSWRLAESRLREALRLLGSSEDVLTLRRVETPEEAERLAFRGSPTVVVNGRDAFADASAPVGLACRLYPTAGGLAGSPTVEQLTSVLAGG